MQPFQIVLLFRWYRHFVLVLLLCLARGTQEQITAPVPSLSHLPLHPPQSSVSSHYYPYAGVFCGAGASTGSAATEPTVGCGAGFSFVPLPLYTEVGVMGPQANRSRFSGYVSVESSLPLARTNSPYLPEVLFGYSRLFETGHALDYGLALILPRPGHPDADLRLELRDYWTFANPNQHNVMLRVGLITFEAD